MLRSMTAFGRAQAAAENEDFLVEIHSVNSRRLEIVINMPGELTQFDPPLRNLIAGAVSRGRLTVFITCQPSYGRGQAFRVNTDMAKQLKEAYDDLRRILGYAGRVDFSTIASRYDLIVAGNPPSNPEKRWPALKAAAEDALAQLIRMKQSEGQNLLTSFQDILEQLQQALTDIEQLAPAALETHKEKLATRVREAAPGLTDNEERILREIAILADKLDICEEIARLNSHIEQFRGFMDDAEPRGRTMDFLIQEMNREINTIGAKAADLRISTLVVRAKTELEKLREQTHNIE